MNSPGHIFLPVATAVLFAGSFVAAKLTSLDLEPLTTTLFRYALALLVLSILVARRGFWLLRITRRDVVPVLVLGLTGVVGYHGFFFAALRHTEVTNTAIINAFSPVVTGVAAAWLLRERLSRRAWAGLVLSVSGVILLVAVGSERGPGEVNRGDLLMLAAVASWTVYALLLRKMLAVRSGTALTWWAAATGVAWLVPLTLVVDPDVLEQARAASAATWAGVLYMGLLASGIGYLLYTLSVARLGATRTSGVVYGLVPVFTAVLSWTFFGETLTLFTIVTAVLILGGLRLALAPSAVREE